MIKSETIIMWHDGCVIDLMKKSFYWLNLAQTLGVLNANILKFLVIFYSVDRLGLDKKSSVALITGIFVLPFILFSQRAGVLADRRPKRSIFLLFKCVELGLLAGVLVSFPIWNPTLLIASVFMMSVAGAFINPAKYGLLPEIMPAEHLSKANGQMLGMTYFAIIIGTTIPSLFLDKLFPGNFMALSVTALCLSLAGLAAAALIKQDDIQPAPVAESVGFAGQVGQVIAILKADRYLLLAVLGSAYFMFIVSFFQQNLLLYGTEKLGLGVTKCGYLFPAAAVGIALGGFSAGRLSGRNIEFGVVPIGAVGLFVSSLMLGLIEPSFNHAVAWIMAGGFFAGLFIVPLEAFIQFRCPRERLGSVLGISNLLQFSSVVVSAVLLVLVSGKAGSSSGSFIFLGVLTLVLVLFSIITLPDFLVRFVILFVTKLVYRIKPVGLDAVPVKGGALLVPNHVTWVDALLIAACHQRRIRFVMAREIFRFRLLNPIFRLMGVIPISSTDSPRKVMESLNAARKAMDDGYVVCIFAEGAITRNGQMHSFKSGMEKILKGSDYPVIPVYIGGAWGSILSYRRGRLLGAIPSRIPYPVTIIYGRPMPASSSAWQVRRAVQDLSVEYAMSSKVKGQTIGALFIKAVRFNWRKDVFVEASGKRLKYGQALIASIMISKRLKNLAGIAENTGIVLPPGMGGALANLAVMLLKKVPVNLNYTVSPETMASAIKKAGMDVVITSRLFLEKIKHGCEPARLIYIEELAKDFTLSEKIIAFLEALFIPAGRLVEMDPDSTATIIFSSGSSGEPKGVVLSHHNVISNIEGINLLYRFTKEDKMCSILPFFHSFGFTCTLWCPALNGFPAFFHYSPLDAAKIVEMISQNGITALLTTPTFLLSYIKRGTKEDFKTLRVVIAGAEKMRQQVLDAFIEKTGIMAMEGYGATELSPVVSVNVPDVTADHVTQIGVKLGSVGNPMPGISAKVVDPDTGMELGPSEDGLLLIKGPNVMKGYIGEPGKTAEVLRDGWYNTGDIAKIDKDGFIFLVGRLSRFSKISGEMVPHGVLEEKINHAIGHLNQCAFITSVPDEAKGEQIVLFYTDDAGSKDHLAEIVKGLDVPNLWKPRQDNIIRLESVPALGSGKLDLKRIKSLASDMVIGKGKQ